ncbi:MAG: hypothetical protein M1822_000602 [Bathelium mastoideum]|nr:MAG: hypothetical protein M1822_000602 [Bathelium mastoideum]
MTGPEGFRPDTPIRVHLQRDEELGPASEFDTSPEIPSPETPADNSTFEGLLQQKTSTRIEGPPPAYGLWRSSVRADPNLLHWQLNPSPHPPSPNPTNLNISLSSARSSPVLPHPQPSTPLVAAATGARSPLPPHHPDFSDGAGSGASDATPVPRPPSYVSEDGVAYVVDALGRRPEMVQRG